jgi:predicted ATPase
MGTTTPLSPILGQLSIFHYVRAEHLKARALAAEALRQAEEDQDPLMVALSRWHLGLVLICLGQHTEARAQLACVNDFYEPDQHHQALIFHRGSDIGQSALAYDACSLWCLGFPDQARQRGLESLALARQFEHPFSLADVLIYAGCMLHTMLRDPQPVLESARETLQIAHDRGFPGWVATATSYVGIALILQGQLAEGLEHLHNGMALDRAVGTRINFPTYYCCLAEAQAGLGRSTEALDTLAEVQALVEETEERLWEPEVHRLRAESLLTLGDGAAAEASFHKALEVARGQEARSWELRAATGLAGLWMRHGRKDEAREMLAGIYGWFTEGFVTPDLQEARELLDQL